MNTPAFTPGPWSVEPPFRFHQLRAIAIYAAGTCNWLACAVARRGENVGERERANAALIAAAPELYEALAAAIEGEGEHAAGCKEYAPGYDDSHCCWVHVARAALAKAVQP